MQPRLQSMVLIPAHCLNLAPSSIPCLSASSIALPRSRGRRLTSAGPLWGSLSATLPVDVLETELARRYELPADSLDVRKLSPESVLLLLPDEAAALLIYNEGRPLQLPPLTIIF
jgi:hypothetical protein